MAKLIHDVDAPENRSLSTLKFIEIVENLGVSKYTLNELSDLVSGKKLVDMSGFSGNSTLLALGEDSSYCIKIGYSKSCLFKEKVLIGLFNRAGVADKVIHYIQDAVDILVTGVNPNYIAVEKIPTYKELAEFMGRSLREFHDIDWDSVELTYFERNVLNSNSDKIMSGVLSHSQGLGFFADYIGDHDYDSMKEYIKNNISSFNEDVIIHGDYNPRNVFTDGKNFKGIIDVTDCAFGDRHYDIIWAMWTVPLNSGVLGEPDKVAECEEILLDAYGRDAIDLNRLEFCKKLCCMYWQESNDIRYFGS